MLANPHEKVGTPSAQESERPVKPQWDDKENCLMNVILKKASVESSPLTYLGNIAGTCTGNEERGDARKRAMSCLENGHMSVFEHIALTWDVRGVSRALTHQLVRHRIASFTQQSQRYVKFDEFDMEMFVVPPDVGDDDLRYAEFKWAMSHAFNCYRALIESGVKAEDARYALPNAMKTNIVATMNMREFMRFYNLRSDKHAQWEIRSLAGEMLASITQAVGGDEEWRVLIKKIALGEVRHA